jgi:hypothetical protein
MSRLTLFIELIGRFIIGLTILWFLVETTLFSNLSLMLTAIMLCLWVANPIYRKMDKEKIVREKKQEMFIPKFKHQCSKCGRSFATGQQLGGHSTWCKRKKR